MKPLRTCFIVIGLFIVMLSAAPSEANPPKKVAGDYNAAAQTLSVTVEHPALFLRLHHVKTVEIKLNGKPLEAVQYETQPGNTFTYTYKVAASPGDAIEVTANCNLYGSKTAKITVPKP